ncbi:MAG: hypothetical protein RIR26_2678, partial [Pseudomonadota bacterium]
MINASGRLQPQAAQQKVQTTPVPPSGSEREPFANEAKDMPTDGLLTGGLGTLPTAPRSATASFSELLKLSQPEKTPQKTEKIRDDVKGSDNRRTDDDDTKSKPTEASGKKASGKGNSAKTNKPKQSPTDDQQSLAQLLTAQQQLQNSNTPNNMPLSAVGGESKTTSAPTNSAVSGKTLQRASGDDVSQPKNLGEILQNLERKLNPEGDQNTQDDLISKAMAAAVNKKEQAVKTEGSEVIPIPAETADKLSLAAAEKFRRTSERNSIETDSSRQQADELAKLSAKFDDVKMDISMNQGKSDANLKNQLNAELQAERLLQ